jgi:hypothetical protein
LISKQENFDFERIKKVSEKFNFIEKKKEIDELNAKDKDNYNNIYNNKEFNDDKIFENNEMEMELNLIPSKPEKIEEINLSKVYLNSNSFEINVDLIKNLTNTGGIENIRFNFEAKN